MHYAIVGYRRTSDNKIGSWQPDIPDGIAFGSICGDTPNTIARLRAGLDARKRKADPNRLAIVWTASAFESATRIPLGAATDVLHPDGRYVLELAIGSDLPDDATVDEGIAALLNSWDDNDPDKPNRVDLSGLS